MLFVVSQQSHTSSLRAFNRFLLTKVFQFGEIPGLWWTHCSFKVRFPAQFRSGDSKGSAKSFSLVWLGPLCIFHFLQMVFCLVQNVIAFSPLPMKCSPRHGSIDVTGVWFIKLCVLGSPNNFFLIAARVLCERHWSAGLKKNTAGLSRCFCANFWSWIKLSP